MTMRTTIMGAVLVLGGCHGGAGAGGGIPAQFVGSWGADCGAPYVRFDANSVHDFPTNADYPLKAAVLEGGQFKVTYQRPDAEVTDIYSSDGSTLTLTKTVSTGGGEAEWHKAPMSKCK